MKISKKWLLAPSSLFLGAFFLLNHNRTIDNNRDALPLISVGHNADSFLQEYARPAAGVSDDILAQSREEKLNFNKNLTINFTERLHAKSLNSDKSLLWSNEASRRLKILSNGIPYQSKPPHIQCGSQDCELSIFVLDGLSSYNKTLITDILAQPAYDAESDRIFYVRQIWSNEDIGDKEPGFRAYYIKK